MSFKEQLVHLGGALMIALVVCVVMVIVYIGTMIWHIFK